MRGLFRSPAVPLSLSMRECGVAGSASHHLVGPASYSLVCPVPQSATLLGLPAATLPESYLPGLPVSAPPTGLDECFFFISLFVGLPHSLIFCQFWLFFVFKFVVHLLVVQGGTVCLPMPPSWLVVKIRGSQLLIERWLLVRLFHLIP